MSSYPNQNAYNRRPNSNDQFYRAPQSAAVSIHSFADAPMTFIATSTKNFMQRHYVMSFLWAVGLLIVTLARGYTVDPHTEIDFNKALNEADKIEQNHVNEAYFKKESSYNRYYRSKGWFSCDTSCSRNYEDYLRAEQQLRDAKKLHNAALSDARSIVGIFSEYAVSDARSLFWSCWEWGKAFAKRISFYDAIFIALDSRNESFAVYIGRMIIRILVNFSIGFFSALISFVWQLWWFVRSYSAGISGIIFFILGSIAAFSLIASAIGAMWIGTAGAAAIVVNMSGPAIEGGRRRRRRIH